MVLKPNHKYNTYSIDKYLYTMTINSIILKTEHEWNALNHYTY